MDDGRSPAAQRTGRGAVGLGERRARVAREAGSSQAISSIWGTSSSDVWLATDDGDGPVDRYNGRTFTEVQLGTRYTPSHILGTAGTDVRGFGRFDGQLVRYRR